jgi:cellobiose-specific phosphotransferase system component IIC
MTEYELVDTFYTIAGLSDQLIVSFITLLFAFLIASYLASSRLDRRMVVVIIALYSFMALRYVLVFYNVSGDLVTLAETINESRLQAGSSLSWLEIGGGMSMTLRGTIAAMFLAYLGSIYFFFYTRNRSNE